jgi:glucosyl-3-phosphoglycerate synthase
MISNWSRVTHAVPDIFHRLMDAVEQDHDWDPAAETRQPVS